MLTEYENESRGKITDPGKSKLQQLREKFKQQKEAKEKAENRFNSDHYLLFGLILIVFAMD